MPSTLYHSGAILTMEGNDPRYAEALVVTDGVIRHVGSRSAAQDMRPECSVDLGGRALLPGFIDAHGHIVAAARQSEQTDIVRSRQAPIPAERYATAFAKAVDIWARNGFTSAQECCLGSGAPDDIDMVMAAAQAGPLPVDILVFAEPQHLARAREFLAGNPVDGVRLGGLKLFLDGSMSRRTGWLSQPYCGMDGQPNACGQARYSDGDLTALVDEYYPSGLQIQAHIDGDEALAQFLTALEAAVDRHGRRDARPVGIHLGQVRPEQWQQIGVLGVVPSFLAGSFRDMADTAAEYVGTERMSWHYAAACAVEHGIDFTSHNDAPLLPQNAMALLDGLVNRTSASGVVYAPEQSVSVFEALRSITTTAAYQNFEEDRKGTLTVGKRADLVILDRDPLTVDPAELLSLRVVETIKDGRTIFSG